MCASIQSDHLLKQTNCMLNKDEFFLIFAEFPIIIPVLYTPEAKGSISMTLQLFPGARKEDGKLTLGFQCAEQNTVIRQPG